MRRQILVAAALMLAALPALAADEERVRALTEASRLDMLGAQMERSVEALGGQPPPHLPESAARGYAELIRRHFDPHGMMDDVEAHLAARLDDADVDRLLDWYAGPAAARIVEAEVAAARADPEEAAVIAPPLLSRMEAEGDPRLALYDRILVGLSAEDLAVALGLNMTYAMLWGMAGSDQLPMPAAPNDVMVIVKRMEPLVRAQAAESLRLSMVHAYRDVSLEDLEAYAGMVETPHGRAYHEALMGGLEASLVTRAEAFGADMMAAAEARDL